MKVQNHCLILGLIAAIIALSITIPAIATLDQVNIVDQLNVDLSMRESIQLSMSSNKESIFTLKLPENAYNILVGNISATNPVIVQLNCTQCSMRISYSLDNAARDEGLFSFYRTLGLPMQPVQMHYVLYLPVGYIVANYTQADPTIAPYPTSMITDGQHIILSWSEQYPELPKQYFVKYENPKIEVTNNRAPIWLTALIMFILGTGIGTLLYKFLKKTPKLMHTVPSSLLSPDEKAIVEYLKKHNAQSNPINQREIGRDLQWSKSKVSAVLSNLYYKKLIEREKFGRNYKVKLLKDVHHD